MKYVKSKSHRELFAAEFVYLEVEIHLAMYAKIYGVFVSLNRALQPFYIQKYLMSK